MDDIHRYFTLPHYAALFKSSQSNSIEHGALNADSHNTNLTSLYRYNLTYYILYIGFTYAHVCLHKGFVFFSAMSMIFFLRIKVWGSLSLGQKQLVAL